MELLICVLLSALVSIVGAWTIVRNSWIDSDGYINGFIWEKDFKDLPSFSSKMKVVFYKPYFENFNHAIGDQLINMKELKFIGGTVLQVHLKPNIEKLSIEQSKTQNLEIDPDEEYAIVGLFVGNCELTRIPKNINHLSRLRDLALADNKIDHVTMGDLNGLNSLEKLYLHKNQMKTISSETSIHLPKLRELWLSFNNLQEINVCSWDMPALESFKLFENKLKFVINVENQFPRLKRISLYGNPLVCTWKENFVRSLKSKNISKWEEATCNAMDETSVPMECPLVYSLSSQLSGLLDRQRPFEQSMENSAKKIESLEEMVKKSNEENQSLKQTVATLTDQLTMLRHSIDDLTEGFYRYVLEKEGGEK